VRKIVELDSRLETRFVSAGRRKEIWKHAAAGFERAHSVVFLGKKDALKVAYSGSFQKGLL
jgi:hypothetical protein